MSTDTDQSPRAGLTADPFVALMRRYVNDYTNRHDVSVCAEIMEPDYTLRMGPHTLAGRDDSYIPAAQRQFTQFPGLCLTVHEIVTNGTQLAMRFSEHGRSVRHGGRAAVWTGIGLYYWNGQRLVRNFVEQDYLARRRQLESGSPARVDPPALAPWDVGAEPTDPDAKSVVRDWISAGGAVAANGRSDGVRFDDGDDAALLTHVSSHVDELFSAGTSVGFHVTVAGTYAGGLGTVAGNAVIGTPATLHLAGLVVVANGRVEHGWVVRDRLGLARALARPAAGQA